MLISLWLLLNGKHWTAGTAMSLLIVAGAWMRWWAVVAESYAIALVSTISLGLAGGVIFTSFTFLPARWFPESERGFATALAVQSNYAGWALGTINPTMFGNVAAPTEEGLRHFLLIVAVITTVGLPIQLAANTRGPLDGASGEESSSSTTTTTTTNTSATSPTSLTSASPSGAAGAEPDGGMGLGATLSMLGRRPQYVIHSACYATLGAVGYAVSGVVDECFSAALPPINGTAQELRSDQTMWLNFGFVVTGVITGILAGRFVPARASAVAVRTLFTIGASSLLAIQILLLVAEPFHLTKEALYPPLLFLMMASGAGTLGFTNIGLRVAVGIGHPADEIYAGSIIEFFLLAISCAMGLLTYVVPPQYAFWFFATPACVACVGIFGCARFSGPGGPKNLQEGLLAAPSP
jgi:hypothetical protein